MEKRLRGMKVAVVGGDEREWELVAALHEAGAHVGIIGLPAPRRSRPVWPQGRDLPSTLAGCHAAIAPLSGTDEMGFVRRCAPDSPPLLLDAPHLSRMAPGATLFIGRAVPAVRRAAAAAGVDVVETEDDDELAVLNSVPTAEGAVQLAMEHLPITVQGSRSVVLGFGRCGFTLSLLLARMGAAVTVVARDPVHRARAESLGLAAISPAAMEEALAAADVVFNTIPARVLELPQLSATRPDVLIIDIAAEPGGVDLNAAQALARQVHWALGIPGKVAPLSAGRILGRCLLRMLAERMAGKKGPPAGDDPESAPATSR